MKAGGAALLLAWFRVTANATTLTSLNLDQLTEAADVIVIGTVIASEGRWEKAHTDIGTLTEIRVSTFLKSKTQRAARLILHHPGGVPSKFRQKDWGMKVDGIPEFRKGQEGTFFLRKKGSYYELVGWTQGFFEIEATPDGRQIVTRNLAGVGITGGQSNIPDAMTLNQLVSAVKKRLP